MCATHNSKMSGKGGKSAPDAAQQAAAIECVRAGCCLWTGRRDACAIRRAQQPVVAPTRDVPERERPLLAARCAALSAWCIYAIAAGCSRLGLQRQQMSALLASRLAVPSSPPRSHPLFTSPPSSISPAPRHLTHPCAGRCSWHRRKCRCVATQIRRRIFAGRRVCCCEPALGVRNHSPDLAVCVVSPAGPDGW